MAPPALPPRYPLLTFAATSRRTQVMLLYGAAVLLIGNLVSYLGDRHQFQIGFVAVAPLVLLVLAVAVRYLTRRHALTVEEEGLRIGSLTRSELVRYELIRLVRVQPLHVVFDAPSRRSQMPRALNSFRDTPACRLRLELDPGEVQRLGRLLGRGTAWDQDLFLLVAQAQELEKLLEPRIRRRQSRHTARPGRRR
ncbi:MAG: hypothetical protein ACREOD_01640 [Candidatus Dormibacteria bacterium]